MKAHHLWMILGVALFAFGLLLFSSSPTPPVLIEIKPLPLVILFLMFSGITLFMTGLVRTLLRGILES